MSVTHTLQQNWVSGSRSIGSSKDYTANASLTIDETIADSSTDFLIAMTLDVSQIKSIYILSDKAITLETNSGSAPAETLTLVADHPYIWNTDSEYTNLLATDITAIYITNASGATATLKIECVYDPTV